MSNTSRPGKRPHPGSGSPIGSGNLFLFNAVIGAVDLDTEGGRARVVGAITAAGAEGARFRSLCDIILGIAVSDAAHEHLEELMGITYKSKFVDGWFQQGRAVGEAEGRAEGCLLYTSPSPRDCS